jgi:hypothetical protein
MGPTSLKRQRLAAALCVAGLVGMAYCHIADVGMKFDEHVYYMAALFCCNIAASLALIPLAVREAWSPSRRGRIVWAAAASLAGLTIAGFLWSRTIGFPQMDDHVGQWDALGLASLAIETLVAAAAASLIVAARKPVTASVHAASAQTFAELSG